MLASSAQRGSRSLDIRRTSIDRFDKRRSLELARSTRRYDEPWGAAERADTRLKCGDGIIHYVHSQVLSLWSPVLRTMIALIPGRQLLESTHGLAYVVTVEEDSQVWAAILDVMYPVLQPEAYANGPTLQCPQEWELLERCLLLADKYDMAVVQQTLLSQTLTNPHVAPPFSMDHSQPSFVLRWLALAEKLQLPMLAQRTLGHLKENLGQLTAQPAAYNAFMAYANEHLSKEQVLQLLQASMQQQQQQIQQLHRQEPTPPVMLLVAPSAGTAWLQQQQQQQVSGGCSFQQQGSAAGHGAAAVSCSGTTSPGPCSQEAETDDVSSSSINPDGHSSDMRQRLALCSASALFAPASASAALLDQPQPQPQQQPLVSFAAPPPRHPAISSGSKGAAAPQQQHQQQRVFALQADARSPPTFGFGINAGSISIDDFMRQSFLQQSDPMCS